MRVLIIEEVGADTLSAGGLQHGSEAAVGCRVGTSAALREALARTQWDIVLFDCFRPAFSSIDAQRIVKAAAPGTPFIVVSDVIGQCTSIEAMCSGVGDLSIADQSDRLPRAVDPELQDAGSRTRNITEASAIDGLQQQINTVMSHAHVPIWIKDSALRYVYANPAHRNLLDCRLEELVGRTDAQLMPPDAARMVQEQDQLALKLRTSLCSEHELHQSHCGLKALDVIRFPVALATSAPLIAGVAIDMSERLSYETRLLEANTRLQRLSSQLIEVQESERKSLARDLHDDISQSLTALKLTLDYLVRNAVLDPRSSSAIDNCRDIVSDVIRRIRNMSLALRPPQLDDLGLAATLQFYMERQCALAETDLHFDGNLNGDRPHPDIEATCFRITQEVFTNIARHSQAKQIWCHLSETGEQIHLTIRDDGRGFDVESALQRAIRGDSSGLLNMRERAALVGGAVNILSAPTGGTCLEIMLPKIPQRAVS